MLSAVKQTTRGAYCARSVPSKYDLRTRYSFCTVSIQPRLVSKVAEELSQTVSKHVKAGQLALTLGGDHSLGMGTVSGSFSAYPDACLIWVDAHADINTPHTTETGNMHGLRAFICQQTSSVG